MSSSSFTALREIELMFVTGYKQPWIMHAHHIFPLLDSRRSLTQENNHLLFHLSSIPHEKVYSLSHNDWHHSYPVTHERFCCLFQRLVIQGIKSSQGFFFDVKNLLSMVFFEELINLSIDNSGDMLILCLPRVHQFICSIHFRTPVIILFASQNDPSPWGTAGGGVWRSWSCAKKNHRQIKASLKAPTLTKYLRIQDNSSILAGTYDLRRILLGLM